MIKDIKDDVLGYDEAHNFTSWLILNVKSYYQKTLVHCWGTRMRVALVVILILLLILPYLHVIQGISYNENYRIVWVRLVYPCDSCVRASISSNGKYVVVTNFSSLLLYDNNGRLLWINRSCGFSLEALPSISMNNKYIIYSSRHHWYYNNINYTPKHFAALFTINGSMLWCKRTSEGAIDLLVLNNGTSIISTPKWVAFIGRNGIVYSNISSTPPPIINETSRIVGIALAEDKGRIAIAYMKGLIVITNMRGDIKSYITVNDALEDVDIDGKGKYIVTGGHRDAVYFLDSNGTLLWEYNVDDIAYGNVTITVISSNSRYIYAGTDTENGVLAFDSRGKLVWWYILSGEYIVDLKTTTNGSLLLVVTNKKIRLFNSRGDLLWDFRPPDNSTIVGADISSDGKYVVVVARGKVYYIENLAIGKPPSPTPHARVTVAIGNYTIGLNDTTLVDIVVYNASRIAGGFMSIAFNDSVVNVIDVLPGDLGQPIYNILGNGTVKIAIAGVSALNKSKIVLAKLLVKGVDKGVSPLNIIEAELNDEEGNLIKPRVINGSITVIEYLKGDVNHNGKLDTGDATLILQMIVGLRPPDLLGDLNNNGRLDTGDVTLLLRKIVGLEG